MEGNSGNSSNNDEMIESKNFVEKDEIIEKAIVEEVSNVNEKEKLKLENDILTVKENEKFSMEEISKDNCSEVHTENNVTHATDEIFSSYSSDCVIEENNVEIESTSNSENVSDDSRPHIKYVKGETEKMCNAADSPNNETAQPKNYKSVILEDWDFELPQASSTIAKNAEPFKDEGSSENNCDINTNNNDNDTDNGSPKNNKINNNISNNNSKNNNNNTLENKEVNTIKDPESYSSVVSEIPQEDNSQTPGEKKELELNTSNDMNNMKSENINENDKEKVKPVLDKKKNPLKYSNLIVSNQDIVEILDNKVERVCRPIIPAKDIFLSIELTKHLNQKLSSTIPGKKKLVEAAEKKNVANVSESKRQTAAIERDAKLSEDTQIITEDKYNENILQKSVASEKGNEEQNIANEQIKKGKKKSFKKYMNIGEEMERTIALRQLRDEFPSTRKRSQTNRKMNHIPFLASSVLEKALTTSINSSDKSGSQRRRPCYLPENFASDKKNGANINGGGGNKVIVSDGKDKKKKMKENEMVTDETKKDQNDAVSKESNLGNPNSSIPVVRTYFAKRKSTDSEKDIKSALETFVFASKELQGGEERNNQFKPKKQKTVAAEVSAAAKKAKANKSTSKKGKLESGSNKKRNLELEKLLGDEGAVRMLYDTQHRDNNNKSPGKKSKMKTSLGKKKDLILKTKLVKNAVLRLSGIASDGVSLRGKRRSIKSEPEAASESDPLFITSTPNVILYKPKKKQRAEASRILYRHSSSESFESSEGCRRTSFEGDPLNSTNNLDSTLINGDLFKEKLSSEEGTLDNSNGSIKKLKSQKSNNVVVGKEFKKIQSKKKRQKKKIHDKTHRDSIDSLNSGNSKLVLSNVPTRKSSRPRTVSKKYSIWASTSMDSLSVESLGFKKVKKASQEFAKKLNYKELRILQHGCLVQIILSPTSTVLKSSFNEQVLMELKEAFDFLAQQDSCNAILLTSNGTTFCQGIDLNYVLSVEEEDRKQSFGNLLSSLKELILCLANYKKPVIAGVHASAMGLGVTLLTYCDIVISSDRASFYTPYARLGQVSEGAATVTYSRINKNLVTELLFKSEKLSATEALKYGLVSQVIPEVRFEEELMLLSRRIALQSMQAMQSLKLLINKNDYQTIVETLEMESQLVLEHWCSNECINNIIKFLNSGEVQFRHLDVT